MHSEGHVSLIEQFESKELKFGGHLYFQLFIDLSSEEEESIKFELSILVELIETADTVLAFEEIFNECEGLSLDIFRSFAHVKVGIDIVFAEVVRVFVTKFHQDLLQLLCTLYLLS